MKRFFAYGFIFSTVLLVFTGCPNSQNPSSSPEDTPEETLVTDFQSDIVIFEGENDYGDWGKHLDTEENPNGHDKVWQAFRCTGFSEGDEIQLTHKRSEIFSEYKMLELCGWSSDWSKTMLTEGALVNATREEDNPKNIVPKTFDQTTSYTLTAKDAKTLNDSHGFAILGSGLCITKVSLKTKSGLNIVYLKNGWEMKGFGCGFDTDTESLHFNYCFAPKDVDWENAKHNPNLQKEFCFDYTYSSVTKKLTIIKTYKVSYDEDGVEILSEISGANNYTASFSSAAGLYDGECGIKFDSLPVKELSDYFNLNAFYPFYDNPYQVNKLESSSVNQLAGKIFQFRTGLWVDKDGNRGPNISYLVFDENLSEDMSIACKEYNYNYNGSEGNIQKIEGYNLELNTNSFEYKNDVLFNHNEEHPESYRIFCTSGDEPLFFVEDMIYERTEGIGLNSTFECSSTEIEDMKKVVMTWKIIGNPDGSFTMSITKDDEVVFSGSGLFTREDSIFKITFANSNMEDSIYAFYDGDSLVSVRKLLEFETLPEY